MSDINNDTDTILVNRNGESYYTSTDMSSIQDTDWLLVNRGGKSYKCSGKDFMGSIQPPGVAPTPAVELFDSTESGRFRNGIFRTEVLDVGGGTGPFTTGIKAKVSGEIVVYPELDAVTAVTAETSRPVITRIGDGSSGTSIYDYMWGGTNLTNQMPPTTYADEEYWTSSNKYDKGNTGQGNVGVNYTSDTYRTNAARYDFNNAQVGDYLFLRMKPANQYELYRGGGWTISGSARWDDERNILNSETKWLWDEDTWGNFSVANIRIRLIAGSGNFTITANDVIAAVVSNTGILGAHSDQHEPPVYTCTFASDKGFDELLSGQTVSNPDGTKQGVVSEIDKATKTLKLYGLTAEPVVGDTFQTLAGSKQANSQRYCLLDPDMNVLNLTADEPDFVIANGNTPYYLKFPATFPTGSNPDSDLPAGTALTAYGEMTGPGGSGIAYDTVVPT